MNIKDLMHLKVYSGTNNKAILIVAPFILKYYILDLTPETSLCKYLQSQGYNVYITVWEDSTHATMDDYIKCILRSIDTLSLAYDEVNTIGYCIGGTMLAIASRLTDKINKIALLCTLVDFKDAGFLSKFVDNKYSLYIMDYIMQFYDGLPGWMMMLPFKLYNPDIKRYLSLLGLGDLEDNALRDWSDDYTRMSKEFHHKYLWDLYYYNKLAKGKLKIFGKTVKLTSKRTPILNIATSKDVITPKENVFKTCKILPNCVNMEISGGHNTGVLRTEWRSKLLDYFGD